MITKQAASFSDTFMWIEKLLDQIGMSGTSMSGASETTVTSALLGKRYREIDLPISDSVKHDIADRVQKTPEGEACMFAFPKKGVLADVKINEKLFTSFPDGVFSLTILGEDEENNLEIAFQEEAEMPSAGFATSYESEEDARLASLMDEYNVVVKTSCADDLGVRAKEDFEHMQNALKELKSKMEAGYNYKMSTGILIPQVKERQLETMGDEDIYDRLSATEDVLRDMEEIAKSNPRKQRRPRRARSSRQNPITPQDTEKLVAWYTSPGGNSRASPGCHEPAVKGK